MANYIELLAKESPEMQAHVEKRIELASIKLALSQLRDELDMSQAELAAIIGVQQPSIARMENADHDPLLSTLK
ncbi:helix-turn-helix domain-containing protein, partial [Xenorhabdus khoisanae]|uniref:helix-turn-helix domain-containing protein n=1 Tax=Xenorhabdus khoisanae TaxID=880157 RepID=UPI00064D0DE9